MDLRKNKHFKHSVVVIALVLTALIAGACSSDDTKPSGALKRTEYCDKYREFDGTVATATPKEQKDLLVAITKAKSFPTELSDEYELVIDGYTKFLAGETVTQNEKKYEEASTKMSRHAIENCDFLKGSSGSSI